MDSDELNRQLAKISEVMADGYHFIQVRALLEDMNSRANLGDVAAQQIVGVMTRFYNLTQVATRTS